MREYRFKRGFKPTSERLEEMLQKHFNGFEIEGEFYVVRNFGAIEELRLKLENKKLYAESKTKLTDDETAMKTLKTYNKFLEELTGYTAKERQKLMKKEAEKED
ncbi:MULTISPECIES: DUF5611 family protein [unclassified Archaeoglobus]|jgi:hypothetical protein|uniref:DUF5611 family protein n=1 Tax=unclassified Archaeoglobus TaxID=2643606 RepID=UPI0025BF1090|nr:MULTISPECIES: DUF5611 family protein [unclassified Archaeoglobus]